MTDDESDRFDWVTETDEKILKYLLSTDVLLTASGIELNLDEQTSYGEVVTRLNKLENYNLVEKRRWGYYSITSTGKAAISGFSIRPDEFPPVLEKTAESGSTSGDDSSGQSDLPPQGTPDVESLQTTRDEAREVLNHQIETLNNVDNKAAYTLRLNIVILGVLLTVSSLLVGNENTPEVSRLGNMGIWVGFFVSGLSIVAALWTYTSTRKETGPGPTDIERLVSRKYSEKQWLRVLLRTYAHWMRRNERVNRRDSFALFISHVLLFVGVGYYGFGTLWGLFFYDQSNWIFYGCLVTLAFLLPAIVLLPRFPHINRLIERVWDRTEPYWEGLYNQ